MTFHSKEIDLPVVTILDDIREKLQKQNTLIVNAPPGAGKSTIVPLDLLNLQELNGQKIIMLEPRRLAARTIAERMASLLGEEVGETVGYRIRFENRIGKKTRIEVVTEGILTRMLHADNSLEGVGAVIFDEFHERSIFADVALALCREAQQILRPDLRIVVMSATLNLPQLSEILQAPVVQSQGRQFPVEISYTGENDVRMLPELAAQTVIRAIREQEGDILTFLPGEGEIRKCEKILQDERLPVEIHPLYGMLPKNKQLAAIFQSKQGKRKIILATSIAETSLTIEGVKVVVDCGYARTSRFDPRSGLSRLETVQISKDSADQRAGRAGRLGPGVCYRMWSRATQEQLAEHRTPEIIEADLADLVLDLAQWGITDPNQLSWLSPPPKGAVLQASELLHNLDALEGSKITPLGKELHRLPCHPRIAHMLIMAQKEGNVALATDLAAVLEERDPLGKEAGIDINLRIEALRKQRAENRLSKKLNRIEKVAESYRQIINCKISNEAVNPYETGLLLVYAYPERIACARVGNNAQFQLANGSIAMAGHRDDLAHESWLAVAHLNAREGMGTIFLASPLNPTDLAPLVKTREVINWDSKKGTLNAVSELRIGSIVLQSKPLPNPDPSLLQQAITDAIKKDGEHLLNFSEEVVQWQNRILSLRKWNPEQNWPDVSTAVLLHSNQEWLSPYLQNIRKADDLKKIDLLNVLQYSLETELQTKLNELAPARLNVPSGSAIKLQYQPNGAAPVLAVRLQEVFGLADTPKVNGGKLGVLMHLLSPGFKPVQVTSDLRSFWNNTYFEVKKELKRRYPKHAWPDDPWTEEAVRGVKRRKNDN
ncbi:ATP-dependent helicase HrpB [Mangrovibacterium diazotrophicum]|uniref:ATP-dependent helicase HrpB n=1 Tax=Mangrovibacterium diazotrophicum TaxID=1261403 RepID=UPI000E714FFF|nr:ATP-dependent helicase HrpB [Mangrovibacterium diazotrophicum]